MATLTVRTRTDDREVEATRVGGLYVHRALETTTRYTSKGEKREVHLWAISAPTGIALHARMRTRAAAIKVAKAIQAQTDVDWSEAKDLTFTRSLSQQTVRTIRDILWSGI